jgi:hypothetical protein
LLWSFVYLVVRNLFALVWLLGRPRRSKELEILVLRHELAVLRRPLLRWHAPPADSTAATQLGGASNHRMDLRTRQERFLMQDKRDSHRCLLVSGEDGEAATA